MCSAKSLAAAQEGNSGRSPVRAEQGVGVWGGCGEGLQSKDQTDSHPVLGQSLICRLVGIQFSEGLAQGAERCNRRQKTERESRVGGGWHFKGSTGPGDCHPSVTGAVAKKRSSTSQVFNHDNDPQLVDRQSHFHFTREEPGVWGGGGSAQDDS